MTLWRSTVEDMPDGSRHPGFRPASLRDKLTDRGWEECECRYGGGVGESDCIECQGLGLLPPEGMVEAAELSLFGPPGDLHPLIVGEGKKRARAALIAAARWEREQ